jgi:hypothetical protein
MKTSTGWLWLVALLRQDCTVRDCCVLKSNRLKMPNKTALRTVACDLNPQTPEDSREGCSHRCQPHANGPEGHCRIPIKLFALFIRYGSWRFPSKVTTELIEKGR